jgi:hypothetical protein
MSFIAEDEVMAEVFLFADFAAVAHQSAGAA